VPLRRARRSGAARCGCGLCSASWLPELLPIGLHIAKDQHLSLNPAQISGPCGRLLCCLRYEHEFYVQSRKRFPKEGKVLATSKGFEKVYSVDIFRDQVTLRAEDGSSRVVPLAELKEEVEVAGTKAGTGERGRGEEKALPVATERPAATAGSSPLPPSPSPASQESQGDGPRKRRRRRRRRGRRGPGGPGGPGDAGGPPEPTSGGDPGSA